MCEPFMRGVSKSIYYRRLWMQQAPKAPSYIFTFSSPLSKDIGKHCAIIFVNDLKVLCNCLLSTTLTCKLYHLTLGVSFGPKTLWAVAAREKRPPGRDCWQPALRRGDPLPARRPWYIESRESSWSCKIPSTILNVVSGKVGDRWGKSLSYARKLCGGRFSDR